MATLELSEPEVAVAMTAIGIYARDCEKFANAAEEGGDHRMARGWRDAARRANGVLNKLSEAE